ncbi:hypothetical protein WJX82_007436 [Trebouxia sp. C0006]
MALSPHSRKPFSRVKGSSIHERGAKGSRRRPVSTHHQLLLLHKGIKKAKQFELRKLIRRLKAAAAASIAGSESTAIKFAAATSERLQAQYDTTKSLNTGVVLQQAASCCGLPQDAAASGQLSNMLSEEPSEASDPLIQLACSRLLSATCTSTGPTAGSHERCSRDAAMSDNEAAQDAEEDRQIADAAMARLLDRRANAAEQSSTSASDNGQKPKEMPKKKKNRLGQRARQQLGRAKQSQQMLHGPYPTPPLLKPHAGQAAPGMKSTPAELASGKKARIGPDLSYLRAVSNVRRSTAKARYASKGLSLVTFDKTRLTYGRTGVGVYNH